ncbi:MAG TPA: thioredoxin domain-containing protein [Brevundimonas sp.]|jgi:protein-disulfide isomerase|uniref:thioredoxin domain-containing protein n=1 Tax=Brevundimonas sp. TaxID=1871086 RepID=UPI002DEF7C90|nr:thioredoxin domain-containing protein [Brevundimonas sp.]
MTSRTPFRFAAMSRRAAITGAALAAMALSACNSGGGAGAAEGDMAKGAAEGAKVTVVEYASVTCIGCAAWERDVWPEFRKKYVDTNQVRYVFREFPTPPQDVAVAGFLLGRCAAAKSGNSEDYFRVVEDMLTSHPGLNPGAPGFPEMLQRIRTGLGFSQEEYLACVTDEKAIAAMEERIRAGQAAGVTGTPTFMVNGAVVADRSLEGLSAAIDAELAK